MLRLVAYTAVLVSLSMGAASAIHLAPTPVQDALRAQIYAGGQDEFKDEADVKKPAKAEVTGRRSILKAGLYSALLPGLGEWYAGHHEKARFFFAGEAVTWAGYTAFQIYGHAREKDYIRFAATNANAQLADKSNEFRDLVGFYTDIDQYNSFGRVWDQERPYLADTPENHWRWQSETDQAIYRHIKNRSREAFRRSDFMIGVAVVSRVVSIIDAIRDVKRANSRLEHEFSDTSPVQIDINPLSPTRQVVLTFRTPF